MPRPPVLRFSDVKRAFERLGFEHVRTSGSHCAFRKAGIGTVVIPYHGQRDVPMGTLRNVLKHAGLTIEQFKKAL
jgi:mRNA interferase HicA